MVIRWKWLAGASLLALVIYVGTISSASAEGFFFTRNLSFGSVGLDVKELQKFLNNHNFLVAQSSFGSPGQETSFFGSLTKAALIKFQKAKQIVPTWGYFGPITRGVVNEMNNKEEEAAPVETIVIPPANIEVDNSLRYSIGGSITGISGPVTLQNNNGDDLTINPGDDSFFTFPTKVIDGGDYSVTLGFDELRHHCYFKDNIGRVSGADITNIKIACGLSLLHNPFEFILGSGGSTSSASQFNCGSDLIDTRDNQDYRTALIGGQCWMTESLNVGTKVASGSSEPACHDVSGGNDWSCQVDNNTIEKYCYDNSDANCTTDGALYEWAEMLALPYDCNRSVATDNGNGTYTIACPTSGNRTISSTQQGICPSGWHVPSFNEYQTLAQNADPGCDLKCTEGACSCVTAAGKLKATAAHSPIAWDGTDIYNFSALPSGRRHYGGNFVNRGTSTFFWTTTPNTVFPGSAWFLSLGSNSLLASGSYSIRTNGFLLRCIKD